MIRQLNSTFAGSVFVLNDLGSEGDGRGNISIGSS